jgi:arylsulfatase
MTIIQNRFNETISTLNIILRNVIQYACISLLLFCLGIDVELHAAEDTTRPNIILIVADDLGYGDLSCYGSTKIKTPRLDALAKSGTRYTNFQVAQAVCTASRAALLSGCYPNRIGLEGALNHTSRTGIHPQELLLSEVLRAAEYRTAAFGKWHLGHQPDFLPTANGFEQFQGLPYSNDNGPLHPTVKGIPPLPWYHNTKVIETDPDQGQFTKRITDLACEFVKAHQKEPFFLYLPHIMPHVPIFASPDFQGKSEHGLYADVVQELDAGIGKLIDEVTKLNLLEQTIIVMISDNGPFLSYGTHAGSAGKLREGKLTAFEGGTRVPLIISRPKHLPSNRLSGELITGLDLYPTLLALAGVPKVQEQLDGQDLSPLVRGEVDAKGRETFYYYSGRELHAVRYHNWKLHLLHEYLTVDGTPGINGKPANFANMKPNSIEQSGVRGIASRHGYRVAIQEQALFDLTTDPSEQHDLSKHHPERITQLLKLAETARDDLGDSLTQRPGRNVRSVGITK